MRVLRSTRLGCVESMLEKGKEAVETVEMSTQSLSRSSRESQDADSCTSNSCRRRLLGVFLLAVREVCGVARCRWCRGASGCFSCTCVAGSTQSGGEWGRRGRGKGESRKGGLQVGVCSRLFVSPARGELRRDAMQGRSV